MPDEAELPTSLAPLADFNAIEMDQGRDFHHHVDLLIRGIEFHIERTNAASLRPSGEPQQLSPDPSISTAPEQPRSSEVIGTAERHEAARTVESGVESSTTPTSSAQRLNEEAPPSRTTFANDLSDLQRPGGLSGSAGIRGGAVLTPPEAANSPILNNLVLTRLLGLVHILFGGLLLSICITFTGSVALSPRSPDHDYLWAFLLLTPAAAMQFVGGYGFWRRKAWSWWLICLVQARRFLLECYCYSNSSLI